MCGARGLRLFSACRRAAESPAAGSCETPSQQGFTTTTIMTRSAFEQLVAEALARIPGRFRKAMANLVIAVEDEPSDELLEEMDIEAPDTLFGLYQGTPLTERGWGYGNTLPDRILLFQGPHEREAQDEDDLVASIGETLIHEIGHYFGLSEEEIEEIEERYWRGDNR
jgi:predicted Zn-dependent protease with MMP-like domain